MPHVVFDEDLNNLERLIAEIKDELSNLQSTIKQIRGEEPRRTRTKLKNKIQV